MQSVPATILADSYCYDVSVDVAQSSAPHASNRDLFSQRKQSYRHIQVSSVFRRWPCVCRGVLIIRGEEVASCADHCKLTIRGIKLKNKDGMFGKSDPFFTLARMREDERWQQVRSESKEACFTQGTGGVVAIAPQVAPYTGREGPVRNTLEQGIFRRLTFNNSYVILDFPGIGRHRLH